MLITDRDELLLLDRALGHLAHSHRQTSRKRGGAPEYEKSADEADRLLLRIYKEHFPVAYEREVVEMPKRAEFARQWARQPGARLEPEGTEPEAPPITSE